MRRSTGLDRTASMLAAVFAALAVAFALFPGAAEAQQADDVVSERLAGDDRYATARVIAEDTFAQGATDVVLASGERFPDALSGNYLAGLAGGPVLLSPENLLDGRLQHDTQAALTGLAPERVWIAGGEEAISAGIEAELEEQGYEVLRVEGPTRYETAAAIALTADETGQHPVGPWEGERTAFVVTGERFPDALAAGPIAFNESFPILLTPTAELHPAAETALEELDIQRVVIAGGPHAVAPTVEAQIEAMGIETHRFFGGSRIETAIEVVEFARDEFGFGLDHTNIAAAQIEVDAEGREIRFADALAMGPHGGVETSPLLLTLGDQPEVPPTLDAYLREHACEITNLHIAGGTVVVTAEHEQSLRQSASDCPEARASVTVAESEVEPGGTITGTITGDDIDRVDVSGPCIDDITDLDIAEDGSFTIPVRDDAEPGDCELTFTVTFTDGTTETHTETITVTGPGETEEPVFTGASAIGEENAVTVFYDELIDCSTVDPNASNYNVILTTDQGEEDVAEATAECIEPLDGVDNEVAIVLGPGVVLTEGDTVTVEAQVGDDGNTVLDVDGNAQPQDDVIETVISRADEPVFTGASAAVGSDVVTVVYDELVDCTTVDSDASSYDVVVITDAGEQDVTEVAAACVEPVEGADNEVAITIGEVFLVDDAGDTVRVTALEGTDGDTVLDLQANPQPVGDQIDAPISAVG